MVGVGVWGTHSGWAACLFLHAHGGTEWPELVLALIGYGQVAASTRLGEVCMLQLQGCFLCLPESPGGGRGGGGEQYQQGTHRRVGGSSLREVAETQTQTLTSWFQLAVTAST